MNAAEATVSVGSAYGNNMVIQRGTPFPVRGTASPNTLVTISYNGQTANTTSDATGAWQVSLPAMGVKSSGSAFTIQESGGNTVSLSNVVVGDVWLCSGQSNMDYTMAGFNKTADIAAANFPGIRAIRVPWLNKEEPATSFNANWDVCSPSTAGAISAVGFYFGRAIHEDQTNNIPIGLMVSAWGGTTIDPWLAPEGLTDIPVLDPLYSRAIVPFGPFSLFNGQIHPIAPFPVAGVIWYQGEAGQESTQSNDSYYLKEKALQEGWRQLLGQDELPFYVVQLANWNSPSTSVVPETYFGGWPDIRQQQENVLNLPYGGVASAFDIGNPNDIHPSDKVDVGERLALWALKDVYNRSSIVPSGPVLRDVTLSGNTVTCEFDYVGSGLMVGYKNPTTELPTEEVVGGSLTNFSIADSSGTWYDAVAVINTNNNTVVLSSPSVANPKKVAYAYWTSPPNPLNFYNREGLPALPFLVNDVTVNYTVTASAGTGGSIAPVGTGTYLERKTALYTITPDAGQYILDVKVDGVSVGAVRHFTFDPLYANHTIAATFTNVKPSYSVTATAGSGATITPSGAVNVDQGGDQSFSLSSAAGGYAVLTVDGKPMGPRSVFAFSDIRKDHTIDLSMEYDISATAGYGGGISDPGQTRVGYGTDKTYAFTPFPGYSVSRVKVDGVDVGAPSSYTFTNVTTSHTISVSFSGGVGGGSIPQQGEILFSCRADSSSFVTNGSVITGWKTFLPANETLSTFASPSLITIDDRPFVENKYSDGDGFIQGNYASEIACNGASIVAVVKPERTGGASGWTSIVDVFYNKLVLGIRDDTGRICVWRNGSFVSTEASVPNGQTTILSLVVQPNGTYKVWANGVLIHNETSISGMTSLTPSGGFASYITVGRNWPDGWTTYNGAIGDVFLYKTALSDAEREGLEQYAASRLAGNEVPTYTITASAGPGGTITPSGSVLVVSNATQSFTIEAGVGGTLTTVLVDGTSVGAVANYTFSDISTDHTIEAVFDYVQPHTITATSSAAGTITPSGVVVVPDHGSQTYTYAPIFSGYAVSSVKVDGVDVGTPSSYAFTDVVADHTISVSFSSNAGSGYVPQQDEILFSCLADSSSFVTNGSVITGWKTYFPANETLSTFASPTLVNFDNRPFSENKYLDGDGFLQGHYASAIPCNGASIVTMIKPDRTGGASGWTSIVDVFYNRLVLGIRDDTGKICVWRNGSLVFTTATIPDGQTTILSLVVQPNGTYKVWANGVLIHNETSTSDMTSLVPGVPGTFGNYITLGRNWPDGWTTYNGAIGDVFLYKTALSDAEREGLEQYATARLVGIGHESMPPVLGPLGFAGGMASFTFDGDSGYNYTVETSTNLVDWMLYETITAPALPYVWQDTNPATNPVMFYRVLIGQ